MRKYLTEVVLVNSVITWTRRVLEDQAYDCRPAEVLPEHLAVSFAALHLKA